MSLIYISTKRERDGGEGIREYSPLRLYFLIAPANPYRYYNTSRLPNTYPERFGPIKNVTRAIKRETLGGVSLYTCEIRETQWRAGCILYLLARKYTHLASPRDRRCALNPRSSLRSLGPSRVNTRIWDSPWARGIINNDLPELRRPFGVLFFECTRVPETES